MTPPGKVGDLIFRERTERMWLAFAEIVRNNRLSAPHDCDPVLEALNALACIVGAVLAGCDDPVA